MTLLDVTVFLDQFTLGFFESGTVDFFESSALCTDQMVVVLVLVVVLVVQDTIPEIDLSAQARFVNELYGPGYSGVAYASVLLSDQIVELLNRQVLLCGEKHIHYVISLARASEPFICHEFCELLFGVQVALFPYHGFRIAAD